MKDSHLIKQHYRDSGTFSFLHIDEMSNEPAVKRWTAKRKTAVVMDVFKGKTTVAEVARQYDPAVAGAKGWILRT